MSGHKCCPLAAMLHTNEKQTQAGGEVTGHQCPLWAEVDGLCCVGADIAVPLQSWLIGLHHFPASSAFPAFLNDQLCPS